MRNALKSAITLIILTSFGQVKAQDDLLNSLDKDISNEINYTAYTFKSNHIINGQSVENMKAEQLDFRINHRFGEINEGLYKLYGLDEALINFSLEYGLTDWCNIGFRRGTYQKIYDGSAKFLIFRQSTGIREFPVTISFFTDFGGNSEDQYMPFKGRFSYTHQLLIARKFNENLSLQLTPSFVHRNLVNYNEDNDVYSIGFGGRYKLLRRISFTWEYFYSPQIHKSSNYFNPVALGFDIETGGHVFQLFVTNSTPMIEKGAIAETTGDIRHGGIHFGFNISRVFSFAKKEE